jgi:ATP-dependent protease ClpP protease subunit
MNKVVTLVLALLFSVSANSATILLTEKNTVNLRGPVDGTSVKAVQRALHDLEVKRGFSAYPLFLVLDTPGGSIDDGEDLIQFAKTIRNLHTVTLFAASMGSAIVQALPGKRLMTENGIQMFHRAKVGLQGQIEDGELEVRLALYKSMVRALEQRNANRMSMPLQSYKMRVKDEMWLPASQALSEKAADGIVDLKCSDALVKREEHMSIQIFIFNINLKFSGCPLMRIPDVVNEPENKRLYNRFQKEVNEKLSGRKEAAL